jgi:protein-serine/threonine kinase
MPSLVESSMPAASTPSADRFAGISTPPLSSSATFGAMRDPSTPTGSSNVSNGGGYLHGDHSPVHHRSPGASSSTRDRSISSGTAPVSPNPSISGSRDKKWKSMLNKFGSIGKKSSHAASSSHAAGTVAGSTSSSAESGRTPSGGDGHTSSSNGRFQPLQGSTVVTDPNSFSGDSYDDSEGTNGSSSRGGSSGGAAPALSASASGMPGISAQRAARLQDVRMPTSAPRLAPAAEVDGVIDANGAPQLTLPGIPGTPGSQAAATTGATAGASSGSGSGSGGGGFASKLLRRVSSAPDTNKLLAQSRSASASGTGDAPPMPASAAATARGNGFLSPNDDNTPSGHSAFASEGANASPTRERDGFFPNSPVRMDSTALSFSSKDFEKGANGQRSTSTPKPRSGISFPGSGRSKSGSMKSPGGRTFAPPASASNLAALQNGANGASPGAGPARGNFRRTYSSNSIKVRDVEVGPSSFSKVKMLGKGDVGKVYLVREKKTEKLFAMKGEWLPLRLAWAAC